MFTVVSSAHASNHGNRHAVGVCVGVFVCVCVLMLTQHIGTDKITAGVQIYFVCVCMCVFLCV